MAYKNYRKLVAAAAMAAGVALVHPTAASADTINVYGVNIDMSPAPSSQVAKKAAASCAAAIVSEAKKPDALYEGVDADNVSINPSTDVRPTAVMLKQLMVDAQIVGGDNVVYGEATCRTKLDGSGAVVTSGVRRSLTP